MSFRLGQSKVISAEELTPLSVIALEQFVLWDNSAGRKTVKASVTAAIAGRSL